MGFWLSHSFFDIPVELQTGPLLLLANLSFLAYEVFDDTQVPRIVNASE
jgi:hypothetical protein